MQIGEIKSSTHTATLRIFPWVVGAGGGEWGPDGGGNRSAIKCGLSGIQGCVVAGLWVGGGGGGWYGVGWISPWLDF